MVEILYLLVPIVLVLVALAVWVFMWAVKSGQYEDLEGPAHRILMDDDGPVKKEEREKGINNDNQ